MIKTFADRYTEELYVSGKSKRFPADILRRAVRSRPRVLSIAGSDSAGGAGIQADIKVITCLGGYAMTAVTAVTAQDTRQVAGIHVVPPEFVARGCSRAPRAMPRPSWRPSFVSIWFKANAF